MALARLAARIVRLTYVADWAFRRFDRLRSLIVLAFSSDSFLVEFSRLAYSAGSSYKPGASNYRKKLFEWEERAICDFFPPAPARILVGAAGGGREPLALIEKGYSVVAFEPASLL